MRHVNAVFAAVALLNLSCASAPKPSSASVPRASTAGAEAAIRAQADAFTRAVNGRNIEALVGLHTPDAVIKYPDGATMDVTALRSDWVGAFQSPTVAFTDTIVRVEVASSGDVAWDYSRWSLSIGSDARSGGSVRTWRKVGDVWKCSSNVAWQGM